MFGAKRDADREPAPQGVVGWRIARLRDAGFDRVLAERMAHDRGYDLHVLLELIDRGCAPELAARILAPVEEREPSRR